MRAVVIPDYGDAGVLQVMEVPEPACGPSDVKVEVACSAMNRADLLQRMGLYPAPGPKPEHEIPGLEFAGRIAEIGSQVVPSPGDGSPWQIGEEVMGIVSGAAMAERLTTHHRMLQRVPASVPLTQAAAIPEVFITAHDALMTQGGLTSGMSALVHAGASGVGTAAIQICKAIGARAAVTCSTPKVAACEKLGADLVIDYTQASFAEEIKAWTKGRGVDVILDVIGGEYLGPNISSLAVQGKIIQVGVMGEASAMLSLGALLPKRASLIGTVLRSRPIEQKIEANQAFVRQLLGLFDPDEAGDGAGGEASGEPRLKPVIDSTYSLAEISAAHSYMATNANVGKILIEVAD